MASKASEFIGLEPLSVSLSQIYGEVQGCYLKWAQVAVSALPPRIEGVMSEGTSNHVYEHPRRI